MDLTPLAQHIVYSLQQQLAAIGQGGTDLFYGIEAESTDGFNSFKILVPDYGKFLDSGTQPHMPPVEPIQRWIEKKGLDLNAWAVATNIKKFGTKAQPFMFVIDDVLSSDEAKRFIAESYDASLDEQQNN